MRAADDRREMMLAVALKADVPQHHHLVVTIGLLEGALQEIDRIDTVTREIFLEGARHPPRRAAQTLAHRIIARPTDEGAHGLFGLLSAWADGCFAAFGGRARPQGFRRHGGFSGSISC